MADLELHEFEFESVTVDAQGEVVERSHHRAQQFCELLAGGVTLEMVLIPGGMFNMGSTGRHGYEDERPQHPVSVPSFFLGKAPVTQEQWQAVMGKSHICRFSGAKLPVDRISRVDALSFCQRLKQKIGRSYRLPGEAEWEYACRAHTAGPFSYGQTLTTDLANYVGEHLFAGEPKGVYRHLPTEAGSFPPNAFGLFDMHGNLWEWCADAWHDNYLGAPLDGSAWAERKDPDRRTSPAGVVRGGSWHEPPNHCRSAVRLKFDPKDGEDFLGFRVALSQDALKIIS